MDKEIASGANADQIAYWNALAGETWAALQERVDRQIGALGQLAMDRLDIKPGERLIDVGCGCGGASLELAKRTGPSGAVLGVDISHPMLAVARRRAEAAGLANLRFIAGDAQIHDFEPGGANALFSRFGVMFFADPAAAFANLRAALMPGGRLAFVCWRALELNPFMTVPLAAAMPLLPEPPVSPAPGAPGPFALADRERLSDILVRAGFSRISLTPHDEAIGGEDIDGAVDFALQVGPLGAIVRERPSLAPTVTEAVRTALSPYQRPGQGVMLPSASWIVTAVKG